MGSRKRKGLDINGWLVLDKPAGLTSNQALGRVKWLFKPKKAGHAGTLDPLATGVLPIALGEATKTVSYPLNGRKAYRFTAQWGHETNTDDLDGEITARGTGKLPSAQDLSVICDAFQGRIWQVPPAFSAIKIDGKRAYKRAREGESVVLPERQVMIHELRYIDSPARDRSRFEVTCGKGTYVRALVRDMGRELGCLGHLQALRRTQVGPFHERDTISLDKLEQLRHSADPRALLSVLRPVESVLDDIPAFEVTQADARRLKRGQSVLIRGPAVLQTKGQVYATSQGRLIALGEIRKGALYPSRVFHL